MPKFNLDLYQIPCATVPDYTLEADDHQTKGMFAMFQYLSDDEKKEYQVNLNCHRQWIDTKAHSIPCKKLMYVLSPEQLLYVFDLSVHSQLNAGKPVLSAGWVTYDSTHPEETLIDNCSGHYTPSLSMFIGAILHLHNAEYLGCHFKIKINKRTKVDCPESQLIERFKNILSDDKSTDEGVTFTVSVTNDGLSLHTAESLFPIPVPFFFNLRKSSSLMHALTNISPTANNSFASNRDLFAQLIECDLTSPSPVPNAPSSTSRESDSTLESSFARSGLLIQNSIFLPSTSTSTCRTLDPTPLKEDLGI